jgi:PAS domain S-box-containing protein
MIRDNKTYKIAVVEDNIGDFILLQDYLEKSINAPLVYLFKCYKDFYNFYKTDSNFNEFDIILLDLSLPDKKGEELIKDVLKITPNIPVVALTGFSDISFAVRTLSLGVFDYLLKDDLTTTMLYKSIIYNIERNKNIAQLKESEHRYSDLFQLSPQPMFVYDKENLGILDVNKAAIDHYGYSKDEFLQLTIENITSLECINELKNKTEDKTIENQVLCKHKKKNGEIITVDVRSNEINFKNQKAIVILANDITENLKHIEAVEFQNQILKEIAWTQSHVVRSPLARLMGLVEILSNEDNSESEKKEMLGYLSKSAQELDDIITDIINKSKLVES